MTLGEKLELIGRAGLAVADFGGYGQMLCQFCAGKGHRIGISTTTAAECRTCMGRGWINFGCWPQTNPPRDPAAEPGGAFSPVISHDRLRVPSGSDSLSPEDIERFMKLARAE